MKKDSAELDVNEVGGMFVILILGCLIAFLFSILEFLWNIRKVAVEEKVIYLIIMQHELIVMGTIICFITNIL